VKRWFGHRLNIFVVILSWMLFALLGVGSFYDMLIWECRKKIMLVDDLGSGLGRVWLV
jgi:hypothetical protein